MISNRFFFYGPKGCGKSAFASATFNEFSQRDPLWITVEIKKASILESPLERLREVFSEIGQYQVRGILIEDIDLLLSGLLEQPGAVQTFLEGVKELGDEQVLIATTRNPREIGDSILSQFDVKVPFYYPPEADRLDILRVHTRVRRQIRLEADVDLSDVAKRTPWFSGADLENTIIWAIKTANGEVLPLKAINEAIDFIGSSISVSRRLEQMKELVEFALNHCTINAVRDELLSYAEALNVLTSSQSSGTAVDLNKILELKPNFCGLGFNINEIIETVRRKFRRKKDKK
jgi:SpoVK/Ycf46/Vps4 family AAA+-type ATPase